jgi:uncharacterized protein YlxW (UPF0749 family)
MIASKQKLKRTDEQIQTVKNNIEAAQKSLDKLLISKQEIHAEIVRRSNLPRFKIMAV